MSHKSQTETFFATKEEISDYLQIAAGMATVGFVKVVGQSAVSRGSGTLVRTGSSQGILTCAHVAEAVLSESEIGIVLFSRSDRFQRITIRCADFSPASLGAPPWKKNGPDLAFMKLPPHVMANLGATASIINLDLHQALTDHANGEVVSAVCGVISEWTGNSVTSQTTITTPIQALLNIGRVVKATRSGEFDLLDFEPIPDSEFKLPASYKGTSGGGLWRLHVSKQQDGRYLLHQLRLSGVAFYEDQGHVTCHGPISIYQKLFPLIQ